MLIKAHVTNIACQKGPKYTIQILKRTGRKEISTGLTPHNEFLLTLMQLILVLINKAVSDCFHILLTKYSFNFRTWIELLSKLLKKCIWVIASRNNKR